MTKSINWRGLSNTIHRFWMENMPTGPIEIGSREEMLFLSNELAGEVGELCNVIKKISRDGMTRAHHDKLRDELGDACIMLHHIEELFSENAELCAQEKTIYNMSRKDWLSRIPWHATPNRPIRSITYGGEDS